MNFPPRHAGERRYMRDIIDRIDEYCLQDKYAGIFFNAISYHMMLGCLMSVLLIILNPFWNPCCDFFTLRYFPIRDIVSVLLSSSGFFSGWTLLRILNKSKPGFRIKQRDPWTFFLFLLTTAIGSFFAFCLFIYLLLHERIFNLWSYVLDTHTLQNFQYPKRSPALTCFKKFRSIHLVFLCFSYILAGGIIIARFLYHESLWKFVVPRKESVVRDIEPNSDEFFSIYHKMNAQKSITDSSSSQLSSLPQQGERQRKNPTKDLPIVTIEAVPSSILMTPKVQSSSNLTSDEKKIGQNPPIIDQPLKELSAVSHMSNDNGSQSKTITRTSEAASAECQILHKNETESANTAANCNLVFWMPDLTDDGPGVSADSPKELCRLMSESNGTNSKPSSSEGALFAGMPVPPVHNSSARMPRLKKHCITSTDFSLLRNYEEECRKKIGHYVRVIPTKEHFLMAQSSEGIQSRGRRGAISGPSCTPAEIGFNESEKKGSQGNESPMDHLGTTTQGEHILNTSSSSNSSTSTIIGSNLHASASAATSNHPHSSVGESRKAHHSSSKRSHVRNGNESRRQSNQSSSDRRPYPAHFSKSFYTSRRSPTGASDSDSDTELNRVPLLHSSNSENVINAPRRSPIITLSSDSDECDNQLKQSRGRPLLLLPTATTHRILRNYISETGDHSSNSEDPQYQMHRPYQDLTEWKNSRAIPHGRKNNESRCEVNQSIKHHLDSQAKKASAIGAFFRSRGADGTSRASTSSVHSKNSDELGGVEIQQRGYQLLSSGFPKSNEREVISAPSCGTVSTQSDTNDEKEYHQPTDNETELTVISSDIGSSSKICTLTTYVDGSDNTVDSVSTEKRCIKQVTCDVTVASASACILEDGHKSSVVHGKENEFESKGMRCVSVPQMVSKSDNENREESATQSNVASCAPISISDLDYNNENQGLSQSKELTPNDTNCAPIAAGSSLNSPSENHSSELPLVSVADPSLSSELADISHASHSEEKMHGGIVSNQP